MEAIILHPKNKSQLSLLKKLAKEMGVAFETKKQEAEEETYNPEFVAKILKGREDSKNGKGRNVTMNELNALWK